MKSDDTKGFYRRLMTVRDNFLEEVTNYCLLGADDEQLGMFFNVGKDTIEHWIMIHPEFASAVADGRDIADAQVAAAMFKRAVGYEYEAARLVVQNGHAIVHAVTEHVPPDTKAGVFWLTNRARRQWRERRHHEIVPPAGGGEAELTIKFVSAQPMLNVSPVIEQEPLQSPSHSDE